MHELFVSMWFAPGFARGRRGFSFTPATLPAKALGPAANCRVVARSQNPPGRRVTWQSGQKKFPAVASTQKRPLKMPLKIRRGTITGGKHPAQMFHGLQQGIGVRAGGGWLLPAKPGADLIQPVPQVAAPPAHRFQRKGQSQLFRRRLEGKSGQ